MPTTIVALTTFDIRFPTSRRRDGSDAMNPDPDYSAAYVLLHTDHPAGLEGHGLTFTIGRGNDLCVAAIRALEYLVVGRTLESFTENMGAFWRHLTGDSQLRWLGPDKGVMHLATAAVVNAVWDLYAKAEGKPVWKLLTDMSPKDLVRCADFRYLTDVLTPEEALEILQEKAAGKAEREACLLEHGLPAYTTSAGWLGYDDAKVRRLCEEGIKEGWTHFKLKVGADLHDDLRRAAVMRETIGEERVMMMDANQIWEVGEAISAMRELSRFNPLWTEEPTSPDDVLGHAKIARAVAPIKVATGEHMQNRVMFKQFLEADALQICQIDAARVGGVNENLAIILMAAKFGVPVCPHAGGVGLCEYVQHLSMFDFIAVSGTTDGRVTEYVDHLHEHFLEPVVVRRGRYLAPQKPGYSVAMKPETLSAYRYPDGPVWQDEKTKPAVPVTRPQS